MPLTEYTHRMWRLVFLFVKLIRDHKKHKEYGRKLVITRILCLAFFFGEACSCIFFCSTIAKRQLLSSCLCICSKIASSYSLSSLNFGIRDLIEVKDLTLRLAFGHLTDGRCTRAVHKISIAQSKYPVPFKSPDDNLYKRFWVIRSNQMLKTLITVENPTQNSHCCG